MSLSLVTSAGKVVTRRFLLSFYGLAKFKGLLFSRARAYWCRNYLFTACLLGRYGRNRA